ncbi:ATP-binding protein [Taylorella equigenitalis]|uniref:ATP-binding protein n=1 Tax=Taylorella equigenitalis TaxID=29575 RepID=UPI00041A2FB3|nr:ATP-binding protein [Taylorella equigenitalis]WDU53540.1 ATP-binding protein [Taylorella equigenitalis]
MKDVFFSRAISVLEQLEFYLPRVPKPVDWSASAYRLRTVQNKFYLESLKNIDLVKPESLHNIKQQFDAINQNTLAFLNGKPSNNVLLTGARGTGKSSLVKCMLEMYANKGLRLVEIDKADLMHLSDLVDMLRERSEKFIIFCDDLSFDEGDVSYKELKSLLDGSIARRSSNVLIYATSNRRHLMPEYFSENEIHASEAIEEKISLSDRFGLWISFYQFSQNEYLEVVDNGLISMGWPADRIAEAHIEALQWATQRGSRSGRIAMHFVRYWVAMHE